VRDISALLQASFFFFYDLAVTFGAASFMTKHTNSRVSQTRQEVTFGPCRCAVCARAAAGRSLALLLCMRLLPLKFVFRAINTLSADMTCARCTDWPFCLTLISAVARLSLPENLCRIVSDQARGASRRVRARSLSICLFSSPLTSYS
jgi:hypothetical protein